MYHIMINIQQSVLPDIYNNYQMPHTSWSLLYNTPHMPNPTI